MTAVSEIRFVISKEFSLTPGPRYIEEGEWSGQDLRERFLKGVVGQAISESKPLMIDLDGTAGYGTSFLEEAFGGLVREDGFSPHDLHRLLRFKSDEEPFLIDDIWEYVDDANAQ